MTRSLAPLIGAVVVWSAYCHIDHGTWAFWSHSVAVNVETGMGERLRHRAMVAKRGSSIRRPLGLADAMAHGLVSLAWSIWPASVITARRTENRFAGGVHGGSVGGIGFVGQHEPSHNLY